MAKPLTCKIVAYWDDGYCWRLFVKGWYVQGVNSCLTRRSAMSAARNVMRRLGMIEKPNKPNG
jgi:hypothetical protein